jgi:hypothetical protein
MNSPLRLTLTLTPPSSNLGDIPGAKETGLGDHRCSLLWQGQTAVMLTIQSCQLPALPML